MQFGQLKRREFILFFGGAAAAWPIEAGAQQPKMPTIGLLRTGSPGQLPHLDAAFHRGLGEAGFVENQNVSVEYRWAEGRNDRVPELLDDLVRRQVSVIAAPGSTVAALAAKAATQTIPIVFLIGADPVEFGLVDSLAHPGGNITGSALLLVPVITKRLEMLHELAPTAQSIALLVNPTNPFGAVEGKEVQAAARALDLKLNILNAKSADDIDTAFPTLIAQGDRAVLLSADALFGRQSGQIAILAARHGIPAISHYREFPAAGGLMSYGISLVEGFRLTGLYVGRILKGEKPADLPVMQPTRFEFVINLRTAKALGIEIPAKLLALADEVIE
jgi:putative ABC transport system substrate-binding protein